MDPERLGGDCSKFEAELLAAGRADSMPERSGLAILAGLGLASPVAASSAIVAGSKLAFMKGVFIVAGIGATGALAVWGGSTLLQDRTPVAVSATRAVVPAAPVAAPAPEATPIETLLETEAPVVVEDPAPAPRAAAVVSKVDTLPLELEAIDSARRALASGNAALASRLLDRYQARFPKPRLRAEATVLRVETLVARGDRSAATRLGKAFLSSNPKSPYARRVRSLIGDAGSESPTVER
jgi:hypothetical protein